MYVRQEMGFILCVSIDLLIRYTSVSTINWRPTLTSIPIQARLSIQGNAWIPTILTTQPHIFHPLAPTTFTDFLATLDLWETEQFSTLTMDINCYTFFDLVNAQTSNDAAIQLLTIMSDGSGDAGAMTFEWIISLPNGKRLAQCSGPTFGPYGSLFHAEGFSFVSLTILGPPTEILSTTTCLAYSNDDG
jgi:hypothetical protein